MADSLSADTLATLLADCPIWQVSDDGVALITSLQFANFRQAFAAMTEIAMLAESLDHHPDWSNVYHKLHITLTTHDTGGLTNLDDSLARHIAKIAKRYDAKLLDIA
ncbi:MAG: 4a-hydroxytetrahydrobiopterin dehydratase [Candidatus Puniceispirillaceae bacterium]